MGKRNRQRQRQRQHQGQHQGQADSAGPPEPDAPTSTYSDPEAGELELRGALSPNARREYADTLSGGLEQEDAWQRATELLFERLAVSWTIAGLRLERQKELIGRYRMATSQERRFVRDSLRLHLEENFPEMRAP